MGRGLAEWSLYPSCSAQPLCEAAARGQGRRWLCRVTVNSLNSWEEGMYLGPSTTLAVIAAWTAVKVCGAWAPVFREP